MFVHLWLPFPAGVILGACYYGGLWWTVRQLQHARHVWWVYFGSLLFRLAVLLSTFYVVLTYFGWQSLAVCLLGVVLSRLVLVQVLGRLQTFSPNERASG